MDIKHDLLMFLYDNRQSLARVNIGPVFKDSGLKQLDIRCFLRDLEADGIIQVTPNYKLLANITAGREATLDNNHVLAKLTPVVGEQYVRDNFLPKPDPTPTIQAHQVVYNTGHIHAPISQADNHSSSSSNHNNIQKHKTATAKKPATFWKLVITIIFVISAIATIYEVWLKDYFSQTDLFNGLTK